MSWATTAPLESGPEQPWSCGVVMWGPLFSAFICSPGPRLLTCPFLGSYLLYKVEKMGQLSSPILPQQHSWSQWPHTSKHTHKSSSDKPGLIAPTYHGVKRQWENSYRASNSQPSGWPAMW